MKPPIEGIKLIRHNMGGVNQPDDPAFGPLLMTLKCRIAGMMMDFAALSIYGPHEIVQVRGKTREALEELIARNNFRTHPRLVSLEITENKSETTH